MVSLKHNPQAWQHREVFDTGLYSKVKFFNAGLEDLPWGKDKGRAEREL